MTLDDGYVPITLFGKDHWSMLAYAEVVMVDCQGFQVGYDARMRQGRQHFRVMHEQCRRPRRVNGGHDGAVMKPEFGSRLNNGTFIENHDDWHCVQDMVHAGLMGVRRRDLILPLIEEMEPGEVLHLTPLGQEVAGRLRAHKAAGGNFSGFRYTPEAHEVA
ncbi:hypothetical protein HOU02_gp442 [Caulobacter phage CcrBL9]|uniref:Uncharacterized protein n=1 Tax=Caulobacter phage CcrBL9 TaxID=2283270 RepID=A0A385EBX2_9CAUD|nr:hypothetical protein HOU02_gp442 [Caulobacter phage CcrBL9]AXQ69283.1 hypothetical protein CcrBL9_gp259c [Caulobacter phage CcrBL9]